MPPHDLNAEAAVLGAIIIDPACIPGVRTFLRVPEAFFKEEHQTFFRVICEVVDAGHPMDAMILHSTLKTKGLLEQVGGIDYIKALANSVPTSSHAEYYAAIVNEKAQLRQQIRIHTTALKNLYENGGTSDALKSAAVENLAAMEGSTQKQAVTSVDALRGALDELERHREGELTGLSTGLVELDNLTGGLQNGEMIIVAARPSVGKTALAMNFVEHVTLQLQQPVAVFSMEMSDKMLMKRMLCGRSGISSHKFRGGHLSEADKTRLGYAVGDLSGGVPFYIDDSSSQTIGDIRGKASRLVKDKGCVMVVIDYMQLMECSQKGLNRQAEITIISRGIKALARDLNVPVVALSQLNRSSESEGRLPRCSDLRESGSIEQDADTILLLHREAVLHRGDYEWEQTHPEEVNSAMLIVAKQRSGPCDSVKLTFLGPQTRFYTYSAGI